MKYYEREITKREAINHFGKLGYVPYIEYVKTNDIAPFNKGKRIHFYETDEARKYLYRGKKQDVVYSEKA